MTTRWRRTFLESAVTSVFDGAILLTLVVPLLLIADEIFRYLKSGIWPPMSLIDAIVYLSAILPSGVVSWALLPQSWLGLHCVCLQIHTALVVCLAGLLVFWLVGKVPSISSLHRDH